MHDERGDNRFAAAAVVAPERVHMYGIPMMNIGLTHRKPRPHRRQTPRLQLALVRWLHRRRMFQMFFLVLECVESLLQ